MASRLRLATEMDCDARVLRRGAEPFAYGSLLITVAGRCAGIRVGVSALADSQSHLERRLTAMIPETRKFARARGLVLGALALTAVLAACEASMPTAEDVKKMDVASLEKNAQAVGVNGLEQANYFIDGKPATSEEVHALGPDKIATIRVMKRATLNLKDGTSQDAGGVSEVRIVTKDAPEGTDGENLKSIRGTAVGGAEAEQVVVVNSSGTLNGATGVPGEGDVLIRRKSVSGSGAGEEAQRSIRLNSDANGPKPLVFIDGVLADWAAMKALNPDRIEAIDVIKGPGAAKQYGADGWGGVIRNTTKK
jgi:hypothetical protein